MSANEKNYKVTSMGAWQEQGRVTLHDELALSGSEISFNALPAGASVPFVHAHKQNEEVYMILKGKGRFYIDGEEFEVGEGDVVRIDPSGERGLTADADSPIHFVCIQTEAKSLKQFTADDGVILETKASWLS